MIFGAKGQSPPNQVLANQVLIDHVKLNAGNKGRSKTVPEMSSYIHLTGRRQENSKLSLDPLWEKEVFATKMRDIRGWSHAKADAEYERLKANPGRYRDNGGWDGAERLEIPSAMAALDARERKQGQFEEKAVQHESRAVRNMSEDDVKRAMSELNRGFTHMTPESFDNWHTPLPAGAATASPVNASGTSIAQLLSDAALQTEGSTEATELDKGDDTEVASAADGPEDEHRRQAQLDPVKRNKAIRSMASEALEFSKKFQNVLKTCFLQMAQNHAKVDEDTLTVLNERLKVVEHFMGSKAKVIMDDGANPEKLDDIDLKDLKYDPDGDDHEHEGEKTETEGAALTYTSAQCVVNAGPRARNSSMFIRSLERLAFIYAARCVLI